MTTSEFYAGARKIVHLRLPDDLKKGMRKLGREMKVFKNQAWDTVCSWYLEGPARRRMDSRMYEPAAPKDCGHTTFWVREEIWKDMIRVGARDGVKPARAYHTAAARYLEQTTPKVAKKKGYKRPLIT